MPEDHLEKWQRVRARVRAAIGENEFDLWLARLQFEYIEDRTIACSLPTESLAVWARKHYRELLLETAQLEFSDREVERVVFLLRKLGQRITPPSMKPKKEPYSGSKSDGESAEVPSRAKSAEVKFHEFYVTQAEADARKKANLGRSDPDELPDFDSVELGGYTPPVKRIISYMSLVSGISSQDLRGKVGTASVCQIRDRAIFLVWAVTGKSLPEIGREFGGRDHTTILQTLRKMSQQAIEDIEFAYDLAVLESKIRRQELLR